MLFATWNVNSLAVRLPPLLDWLAARPVDALVLQETKLTDDKFPRAEIEAAGYQVSFHGQKTYNGVALLTRAAHDAVQRNLPGFADEQARLIAAHHRTAAGLELLGARGAFASDAGVRRALLQNPLLPVGLYRRLWAPRRLLEQFQVTTSREAPEQVRAMARDLMRASFNQRVGEERAEFILATEGRCLASLVGLTLDSHATAILCRRTYTSTLLVQNLARWSAAPPALIAHLRRQDLVKRNPVLRQMLERHPNAT